MTSPIEKILSEEIPGSERPEYVSATNTPITPVFTDQFDIEGYGDKSTFTTKQCYDGFAQVFEEYGYVIDREELSKLVKKATGKTPENMTKEDYKIAKEALEDSLQGGYIKHFFNALLGNDDISNDFNSAYILKAGGSNRTLAEVKKQKPFPEQLVREGYIADRNVSDEDMRNGLRNRFKAPIERAAAEARRTGNPEILKEAYKQTMADFTEFLVSVKDNPKQTAVLESVIDELGASFRETAVKLVLLSCQGDREKAEIAAKILLDNDMDILTHMDEFGNVPDKMQGLGITETAYRYASESDIREHIDNLNPKAQEFFNTHSQEEIDNIRNKANRTSEETEILNQADAYTYEYAGGMMGTCQNESIQDDARKDIVNIINTGADNCNISYQVYSLMSEYIETYPEAMTNMSKDDFVKFMDEITNNKFSQALTEYKDNASEGAKEKTETSKTNSNEQASESSYVTEAAASGSYTAATETEFTYNDYTTNPFKLDFTQLDLSNPFSGERESIETSTQDDTAKISAKSITEKQAESIADVKTRKQFKEYVKKNGLHSTIAEVFNNFKDCSQKTIELAKKHYQALDPNLQKMIIETGNLNGDAIEEILKYTSDKTISSLDENAFANDATKKRIEKAKKELEDKNNNLVKQEI